MNSDELLQKVPEKFRPLAQQYLPAFVAMTEAEIIAWTDRLGRGDVDGAYEAVIKRLPNQDLLNEWTAVNAQWDSANAENSRRMALVREARSAVMGIMLTIALAAVGL